MFSVGHMAALATLLVWTCLGRASSSWGMCFGGEGGFTLWPLALLWLCVVDIRDPDRDRHPLVHWGGGMRACGWCFINCLLQEAWHSGDLGSGDAPLNTPCHSIQEEDGLVEGIYGCPPLLHTSESAQQVSRKGPPWTWEKCPPVISAIPPADSHPFPLFPSGNLQCAPSFLPLRVQPEFTGSQFPLHGVSAPTS